MFSLCRGERRRARFKSPDRRSQHVNFSEVVSIFLEEILSSRGAAGIELNGMYEKTHCMLASGR